MPPFFDQVELYLALQNQAIPALEALAANDNLRNRSLRRFERDNPPSYASSTDSEEGDYGLFASPPGSSGELPEELRLIMERPINDDELRDLARASYLGCITSPSHFYHTEAGREKHRLDDYWQNKIFRRVEGSRRCGIIVRHSIKRRWEKLGIWNPEWGFAGRSKQPGDDAIRWKWRWEQEIADSSGSGYSTDAYMEQLMTRALRLRQNLRRGDSTVVLPQSRLELDATASQAESFIISRPWFIFQVELAEERTRYDRLSREQQKRHEYSPREQVIEWWKERGDWREEFDRKNWVTSWKWRHESPSPEPEDLTPINKMEDSPLDTTDMEFTPSEIDDLETIELPSSEQPKRFWYIRRGSLPPYFPGQLLEPMELAQPSKYSLLAQESLPDMPSIFGPLSPRPSIFPRRSARIAAMKSPPEPLISHASKQGPPADIGSAGSKSGDAERSPSEPTAPQLRTGKRVLCPKTRQAARPSKSKLYNKEGQPHPVPSISLGPFHSSKVLKRVSMNKPGSQRRPRISGSSLSSRLALPSVVAPAEVPALLNREAPRRSNRIQRPIGSVSKEPTSSVSTDPSKRTFRSKTKGSSATRNSAKSQGISKNSAQRLIKRRQRKNGN